MPVENLALVRWGALLFLACGPAGFPLAELKDAGLGVGFFPSKLAAVSGSPLKAVALGVSGTTSDGSCLVLTQDSVATVNDEELFRSSRGSRASTRAGVVAGCVAPHFTHELRSVASADAVATLRDSSATWSVEVKNVFVERRLVLLSSDAGTLRAGQAATLAIEPHGGMLGNIGYISVSRPDGGASEFLAQDSQVRVDGGVLSFDVHPRYRDFGEATVLVGGFQAALPVSRCEGPTRCSAAYTVSLVLPVRFSP